MIFNEECKERDFYDFGNIVNRCFNIVLCFLKSNGILFFYG